MSRLRRFTLLLGALVAVPLAVALVAFAVGASIDVSRWRDAAAEKASAALGRPVLLQGALRLTLGREPTLHIGALRMPNGRGFAAPDMLSIGDARVRFGLFDLLRGLPRLRGVEADDVELWLERTAGGQANWSPTAAPNPETPPPDFDMGHLRLTHLNLHYRDDRSSLRRHIQVDTLSGSVGTNLPLQLSLRGQLDVRHELRVELEGGPLRLLRDAAAPWPFKLELMTTGGRAQASGGFDISRGEARFDFSAAVDDPAHVGSPLGLALPPLGRVALRGHALATTAAIEIDKLQGTLGGADLSGRMALAFAEPRPRLKGALHIATLDLRRRSPPPIDAVDPQPEAEGSAWQAFALRDLLPFDAELELNVGQWLGLPVEVRDLNFGLRADARGLRAPLSVTVAGAHVAGYIDLDSAAQTPTLALQLAATDIALADPVRDGWGVEGIAGRLGHFDMRLAGRGETLGAWLRDLEVSIAMQGVDARPVVGGRPMSLKLDAATLLARRGERVRGSARGSLLGEPAELSLRGGTLPEMLRTREWPIELRLMTAGATLRLATDLTRVAAAPDTVLNFDLQAPRSGDLSRWLGVAADSSLPLRARGQLRLDDQTWRLDATTLQLGHSELTIDAAGSRADADAITTATVHGPLLDVPELASLRASASPAGRIDARGAAKPVAWPDADLQLDLDRVRLGRTELAAVGLSARIRQGHLLPSPITARVAGTTFTGRTELDARGAWPLVRLELSARDIEVGRLLRELAVADGIDGRFDALQLSLQGQGGDGRKWAEHTDFQARLVGGRLALHAAPKDPPADIRVHEATIGAAAGEPIRLAVERSVRSHADSRRDEQRHAGRHQPRRQPPAHCPAGSRRRRALDAEWHARTASRTRRRVALRIERRAARHPEPTDTHRAACLGAVVDRRPAGDHPHPPCHAGFAGGRGAKQAHRFGHARSERAAAVSGPAGVGAQRAVG